MIRHLSRELPQHARVMLGTGPEFALNREIAALAGVPQLVNAADDLPIPHRPRGSTGAEVRLVTGMLNGRADMLCISAADVITAWDGLTLRLPRQVVRVTC